MKFNNPKKIKQPAAQAFLLLEFFLRKNIAVKKTDDSLYQKKIRHFCRSKNILCESRSKTIRKKCSSRSRLDIMRKMDRADSAVNR